MKTDRYTRVVLTFIAGLLALLVCQSFFEMKSATASMESRKVIKVAICSINGKLYADIWKQNGRGDGHGVGVMNLR